MQYIIACDKAKLFNILDVEDSDVLAYLIQLKYSDDNKDYIEGLSFIKIKNTWDTEIAPFILEFNISSVSESLFGAALLKVNDNGKVELSSELKIKRNKLQFFGKSPDDEVPYIPSTIYMDKVTLKLVGDNKSCLLFSPTTFNLGYVRNEQNLPEMDKNYYPTLKIEGCNSIPNIDTRSILGINEIEGDESTPLTTSKTKNLKSALKKEEFSMVSTLKNNFNNVNQINTIQNQSSFSIADGDGDETDDTDYPAIGIGIPCPPMWNQISDPDVLEFVKQRHQAIINQQA